MLNTWLYMKIIKLLRYQAKLEAKNITINGYGIAYLESKQNKDKPTLILIHGMNDEKDTWLPLATKLKNEYHLILIDLLGCGESEIVEEFDYSLASQADFMQETITQIIEKKGIKHFSLVGHSMGGGLAVISANKLPIDKLILVDNMGIHQTPSYFEKLAKEIGEVKKLPWIHICSVDKMKGLLKNSYYKMPYIPTFILKHFVAKKCKLGAFEEMKFRAIITKELEVKDNLSSYMREIKHDTLIVWGGADKSIHVDNAKEVHTLIPNSTLKVYTECGHYPQAEKPKELAKDIKAFLK
ncbi:MAG: alpha/beta hydrolase [Sulfurovum sp.]|nr:alpha/beta hydrolase [Sulfurovum sp.]